MGDDLDDIWVDTECPGCGNTVRFTYGQARLAKAAACSCGVLLRLDLADTGIEAVQRLVDETNPIESAND